MLLFKCFCFCFDFAKCRHECPSHNRPAALRCLFTPHHRAMREEISLRFRRFGLNVSLLISHARCNCALEELCFLSSFFFQISRSESEHKSINSINLNVKTDVSLKQKKIKTKFSGIFFFLFRFIFLSLLYAPWGSLHKRSGLPAPRCFICVFLHSPSPSSPECVSRCQSENGCERFGGNTCREDATF